MIVVDQHLLDQLSNRAAANPRARQNWNIHPSDDFCCHRLLNAIEPGSYIRPHRHQEASKDETFVIVRGRLGVLVFDAAGEVRERVLLAAGGDALAVNIPHGVFHGAVSLATGTVFFEAKAGPYRPLTEDEKARWAPAEGTEEATSYLAELEALF
jgi:cupin fold WbuC family metalloprotein